MFLVLLLHLKPSNVYTTFIGLFLNALKTSLISHVLLVPKA